MARQSINEACVAGDSRLRERLVHLHNTPPRLFLGKPGMLDEVPLEFLQYI